MKHLVGVSSQEQIFNIIVWGTMMFKNGSKMNLPGAGLALRLLTTHAGVDAPNGGVVE